MLKLKEAWKGRVAAALNALLAEAGLTERVNPDSVIAENPPAPEMGDMGFPMFGYAKLLRKGPPHIAEAVVRKLASGGASAAGPYVNVRLDRGEAASAVLQAALGEAPIGRPGTRTGSRIMVEFSSPNTNKPLHLGHLRNDILGESISRILAACGAEVRKVCVINDRGIHICKSMLAYQEQGGGKTPESEGVKSDHFVGDYYVRYNEMAKTDPGAESRARELLRKWESGDEATTALWKTMNKWTIDGMKATYGRTGVSFDQYYFESETYLKGKEEILKGLENGIFYRAEDGAVMVDLEAEKLDKKALLRADGTSIYITQDIGLAIYRNRDWPFDRLVYVVGSEQQYHFKVLFAILGRLGFPWAKNLYHLSYGMVNLPEGKMKSREGTVVDADDLLDSLRDMARKEIREKEREEAVGDSAAAAEKIALGALHYFLLSVSPSKDMLFNPKESLSFNGDTGPYLQYMGARISSMLRKAGPLAADTGAVDYALLSGDPEWELVKVLGAYNEALAQAADTMDPSLVSAYLYSLSRAFSRFYHDCPILQAESPALTAARLALSRAVFRVLKDALSLICIPFLESM
jgi:arginyl-tRNA synthetase